MTTDEQVSALRRTATMMRDGSETITLRQQVAEVRDLLEWLKEHDSARVPAMRAALLTLMETEAGVLAEREACARLVLTHGASGPHATSALILQRGKP